MFEIKNERGLHDNDKIVNLFLGPVQECPYFWSTLDIYYIQSMCLFVTVPIFIKKKWTNINCSQHNNLVG